MHDETPTEPVSYRRAVREVGLDILVAVFLVLSAALAIALAGLGVDADVVVLLATIVAGEHLWRRRDDVPDEVPRHEVSSVELDKGSVGPWAALALWLAVGAGLFGAAHVVGGGNVLLGFFAGFVVRDAVLLLQVRTWERRHGRLLVWRREGERRHSAVLAVS